MPDVTPTNTTNKSEEELKQEADLKQIEKDAKAFGKYKNATDTSTSWLSSYKYNEQQIDKEEDPMMKLFMKLMNDMIMILEEDKTRRDEKRQELITNAKNTYEAAQTREEKQVVLDYLINNKKKSTADKNDDLKELTERFKANQQAQNTATNTNSSTIPLSSMSSDTSQTAATGLTTSLATPAQNNASTSNSSNNTADNTTENDESISPTTPRK